MRTHRTIILATNTLDYGRWKTDKQLAQPYSRFCALCRSLAADGFDYQVTLSSDAIGTIRLLVAGIAPEITTEAHKPKPHKRHAHIPPARTMDYCTKQIAELNRVAQSARDEEWTANHEYWHELLYLAENRALAKEPQEQAA